MSKGEVMGGALEQNSPKSHSDSAPKELNPLQRVNHLLFSSIPDEQKPFFQKLCKEIQPSYLQCLAESDKTMSLVLFDDM